MNWNIVGSILGRSSVKIAYFVLICYQTWPPQAILASDWVITKKSSLKWSKESKYWKHPLLKLLIYFRSVNKHGCHSQFLFLMGWFLKKSSPLKLSRQTKFGRKHHGRFCIKFSQSRMKLVEARFEKWHQISTKRHIFLKNTNLLWIFFLLHKLYDVLILWQWKEKYNSNWGGFYRFRI